MGIEEAIDLIRFTPSNHPKQVWADFGCGEGVFTSALASLLPEGSTIKDIDLDRRALRKMPAESNGVVIEKVVGDFTSDAIVFHEMDGIIMANSLHYVKDKERFVRRMFEALKVGGNFLLVDYDMSRSNPWVPYPLPISVAEKLFLNCGAASFDVINKRKSVFGERWMYAAAGRK